MFVLIFCLNLVKQLYILIFPLSCLDQGLKALFGLREQVAPVSLKVEHFSVVGCHLSSYLAAGIQECQEEDNCLLGPLNADIFSDSCNKRKLPPHPILLTEVYVTALLSRILLVQPHLELHGNQLLCVKHQPEVFQILHVLSLPQADLVEFHKFAPHF